MKKLHADGTEWSKKALDTLQQMSPTSLKVVHRQIREGANKSLPECLKMEFRIARRLLRANDFYEGVRAKLVDKDNKPKWKPIRLEDVSDAEIDNCFKRLSHPEEELKL